MMNDGKEKLKDMLQAVKADTVDVIINHDNLSGMLQDIAENIVSEGVAELLGDIIGAILPRANGIIISYKQRRFERNILQVLSVIKARLSVLEENYNALQEEVKKKIGREYLEWMLDNVYSEKQIEKIPYHVNGYINLMTNDANDDLMLNFFNTLNELTRLDIEVLAMYSTDSTDNIVSLCERNGLEFEQVTVIKEKLVRHGLLKSRNEEQRDESIDKIAQYMIDLSKDMKKSKPQGVNPPSIKKPHRSDSYQINALGRGFLKVISYGE